MKTTVIIDGKEEEREVYCITKNHNSLEPNEIVPVLHDGEGMTWILNGNVKQALIFKKQDKKIKDLILNDLKGPLFELAASHSRLAQAEYNRNPQYNDTHFSHKAEMRIMETFKLLGVLDEFLHYLEGGMTK